MKKIVALVLVFVLTLTLSLTTAAMADKADYADLYMVGNHAEAFESALTYVSLPVDHDEQAINSPELYRQDPDWAFDGSVRYWPFATYVVNNGVVLGHKWAQNGYVVGPVADEAATLDSTLVMSRMPIYGVEIIDFDTVMADDIIYGAWANVLNAEMSLDEFYEELIWQLIARVTRIDEYTLDGVSVREARSLRAEEYDSQIHGDPIAKLWLEVPAVDGEHYWYVYERELEDVLDDYGQPTIVWTLVYPEAEPAPVVAPAQPQGEKVTPVTSPVPTAEPTPAPTPTNVDPEPVWEPVDEPEPTAEEEPWDPGFNFDPDPTPAPVNVDPAPVWEPVDTTPAAQQQVEENWDAGFNFEAEQTTPSTAPVNVNPAPVWDEDVTAQETIPAVPTAQADPAPVWDDAETNAATPAAPTAQADPATVWEGEESQSSSSEEEAWDAGFNF